MIRNTDFDFSFLLSSRERGRVGTYGSRKL